MAYQGLNTPTPPFQNLTVTYIIQNGCYRASYMKMYLTPPFLVFHPPSLSLFIPFLHSCTTGIWLEIILMCVYMSFHIFKWSRTGFFFQCSSAGWAFWLKWIYEDAVSWSEVPWSPSGAWCKQQAHSLNVGVWFSVSHRVFLCRDELC